VQRKKQEQRFKGKNELGGLKNIPKAVMVETQHTTLRRKVASEATEMARSQISQGLIGCNRNSRF
jgi:hypothetical protein